MGNFYSQIENIASKFTTNNIYIVGKGRSIDDIIGLDISRSLVINLNDSYQLFSGDIVLVSRPEALNGLKEKTKKCFIVSDLNTNKYTFKGHKHYILPSNNKILRFNNDIFIEEFIYGDITYEIPLFITALKIAFELSKIKKTTQNVYCLGMDFSFKSNVNYTSRLLKDDSREDERFKKSVLQSQSAIFYNFIRYFKESKQINLIHVGNKKFSSISTEQFVIKHKIKDNKRYPENNVLIVAELTTNHYGNRELLLEMVRKAKIAGADLVKVQKRNIDTFYSKNVLKTFYYSIFGETYEDYRRGIELDYDDFCALADECKKLGIEWFTSVLDMESLKFILDFYPTKIKIPSTISTFTEYHNFVSKHFVGEIIVSTGMTNAGYEKYIIEKFSRNKKIYLLQCTSSYPTKPQDCHLGVIRHYRDLSKVNHKIIPGYSSHDLGSLGSMLAVAAGAKMIEKHVKIKNVSWGHYDSVAIDLNNDDFNGFIRDIRHAEAMVSDSTKSIISSEHHKYQVIEK